MSDSPPPATTLPSSVVDPLIEAWLVSEIYNSPIAEATDCWNYLVNVAIPALKRALEGAGS